MDSGHHRMLVLRAFLVLTSSATHHLQNVTGRTFSPSLVVHHPHAACHYITQVQDQFQFLKENYGY